MTTMNEFKILGALADGPKTFAQIVDTGRWSTSYQNFLQYVGPLEGTVGLVGSRQEFRKHDSLGRWNGAEAAVYFLTGAGRTELERFQQDPLIATARRIGTRLPPSKRDRRAGRSDDQRIVEWAEQNDRSWGLLYRATRDGLFFFEEARNLRFEDLDFERRLVRIRVGPRKGRRIPMTREIASALDDARRPRPDDYIFATAAGRSFSHGSLYSRLSDARRRLGLKSELDFRRGRAVDRPALDRVLSEVPSRCRPIVRFYVESQFDWADIYPLRVKDIDLENGEAICRAEGGERRQALTGAAIKIIRPFVTLRSTGLVFEDRRGKRRLRGDADVRCWTRGRAQEVFRVVRDALGLPPETKFLGRQDTWTTRRGGRPPLSHEAAAKRRSAPLNEINAEKKELAETKKIQCQLLAKQLREKGVKPRSLTALIAKRTGYPKRTIERYLADRAP